MKKQIRKYYDVLTTSENGNEATILLYGYIGESFEYDYEEGWKDTGIKDIDFVQALNALAERYPTIHIRINSPGGEVFHGAAIVSAIRKCKAEVHTYIDGVAASMAGVIWAAGHKRHMAKNGMLMLHSASGGCWGNAADMREVADTMDTLDQTLIISIADSTGMSEADVKSKYFDYKDHWMSYNDVMAEGWISEPDEYESATPPPANVTAMAHHELLRYFNREQKQATDGTPGILQRLRAAWHKTIAAVQHTTPSAADGAGDISHHKSITEMNLDEFKKAVQDGSLSIGDVKAHLDELAPAPPATPETPPEPQPDATLTAAITEVKAENATLKQQLADLALQVQVLGKLPGASKAAPELPAGDPPPVASALTAEAEYLAMVASMNKAADNMQSAPFRSTGATALPPAAPATESN